MPPKAVVYHICGQHLAGQAVVGYAVGPDTPIMLAPKLFLRGGAWKFNVASAQAPVLVLRGKATGLAITGTATLGKPTLLLKGGPHIVGKEVALVPTTPGTGILVPTTEEDFILIPTTEENWLLVPTVERVM